VYISARKFARNMACLNNLKSEIKTLEKLFPKSHERFAVINASVDELTCRFITKSGKKFDIHANITVRIFHICFFFEWSFFRVKFYVKKGENRAF
jgi:hypothetical protein